MDKSVFKEIDALNRNSVSVYKEKKIVFIIIQKSIESIKNLIKLIRIV